MVEESDIIAIESSSSSSGNNPHCLEITVESDIIAKESSSENSTNNPRCLEITESIRQQLSQRRLKPSSMGSACSIFRVHNRIRRMKDDAYTSDMVSIGPYHHDITSLKKLVVALTLLESAARCYYEEPIELSSIEFVGMTLLDGIFILELFQKYTNYGLGDEVLVEDSHFRRARIMADLVLLENQIPLFILETLFNLLSNKDIASEQPQLIQLALKLFRPLIPNIMKYYDDLVEMDKTIRHSHLLCLLYYTCGSATPRIQRSSASAESLNSIPYVSELLLLGVEFEKMEGNDVKYIDMKYMERVFKITPLCINDYTYFFFQNLMAYELHRLTVGHRITSYRYL
ncbi:UPF0481 protein At3g47200-like [Telopea speciosissima]|uniref:UPF0481 protein At3g47200-like n=1 Tax=Telopea speciosissima TaxID=54955 RepID=UPI001CC6623A|nr:UPF0481 protein At3g47200-like [Telopea speciosissima]